MERAIFYDQIALFYRDLSKPRENYINTVNHIVINEVTLSETPARSMLDIGAADGVRGIQIAQQIGIQELTLLEPSQEMVALINNRIIPQNIQQTVIQGTAESLSISIDKNAKFDVITVLWNVLGHIPDHQSRISVLNNLKQKLSKNGKLYFDLNNRYNVSAYGKTIVFNNYMNDKNNPSKSFNDNGNIFYDMHVNDKKVPAWGHVFSSQEAKTLIHESGLNLVKQYLIDYDNGKLVASFGQGNPLFICN